MNIGAVIKIVLVANKNSWRPHEKAANMIKTMTTGNSKYII